MFARSRSAPTLISRAKFNMPDAPASVRARVRLICPSLAIFIGSRRAWAALVIGCPRGPVRSCCCRYSRPTSWPNALSVVAQVIERANLLTTLGAMFGCHSLGAPNNLRHRLIRLARAPTTKPARFPPLDQDRDQAERAKFVRPNEQPVQLVAHLGGR